VGIVFEYFNLFTQVDVIRVIVEVVANQKTILKQRKTYLKVSKKPT
jgi:hypothetical protein